MLLHYKYFFLIAIIRYNCDYNFLIINATEKFKTLVCSQFYILYLCIYRVRSRDNKAVGKRYLSHMKHSSVEINRSVPLIKAGCDMNQQQHITTTLMGGTVDFKPRESSVIKTLFTYNSYYDETDIYIYAV